MASRLSVIIPPETFRDVTDVPIAIGRISFLITDQRDIPIPCRAGQFQYTATEHSHSLTQGGYVGAITIPNPAETTPQNVRLRITVTDFATNKTTVYLKVLAVADANGEWDLSGANLTPDLPGALQIVGNTGKSAYELAVSEGYSGTLDQWLASLVGKTATFKGAYSGSATYYAGDAVSYNGSSYVCLVDGTTDHLPTETAVGITNLFDKSAVTAGQLLRISDGGTQNDGGPFSVSDYIPVTAGTIYTSNLGCSQAQSPTYGAVFYDSNKQKLSVAATTPFNSLSAVAPPGAAYLRTILDNGNIAGMMIVADTTLPPSYIGYGQSYYPPFTQRWGLLAAAGGSSAASFQIGTVSTGSTPSVTITTIGNTNTLSFVFPAGGSGSGTQASYYDALAGSNVVTLAQAAIQRVLQRGEWTAYRNRFDQSWACDFFGDSITAGAFSTGAWQSYVHLAATILAANIQPVSNETDAFDPSRAYYAPGFANRGTSGYIAADLVNHVFNFTNYAGSGKQLASIMIGTNDAARAALDAGALLNYQKFLFAAASWLTTRSANRVDAGGLTEANWTNDTFFSAVTGKKTTTNGASLTFALTTYGKPVYVWFRVASFVSPATFTVAIDGGTPVAVSTAPDYDIAGNLQPDNSHNASGLVALRLEVAAGAHSIVVTATKANALSILSVGTMSPHTAGVSAAVGIAGVPPQNGNAAYDVTAHYSYLAARVVEQLQNDGADIRYVDSRTPMQNGLSSLYQDGLHPNNAGHAALALAFVDALRRPAFTLGQPGCAARRQQGHAWR